MYMYVVVNKLFHFIAFDNQRLLTVLKCLFVSDLVQNQLLA